MHTYVGSEFSSPKSKMESFYPQREFFDSILRTCVTWRFIFWKISFKRKYILNDINSVFVLRTIGSNSLTHFQYPIQKIPTHVFIPISEHITNSYIPTKKIPPQKKRRHSSLNIAINWLSDFIPPQPNKTLWNFSRYKNYTINKFRRN